MNVHTKCVCVSVVCVCLKQNHNRHCHKTKNNSRRHVKYTPKIVSYAFAYICMVWINKCMPPKNGHVCLQNIFTFGQLNINFLCSFYFFFSSKLNSCKAFYLHILSWNTIPKNSNASSNINGNGKLVFCLFIYFEIYLYRFALIGLFDLNLLFGT